MRIDDCHLSIAKNSLDRNIRILQTQQIDRNHLRGAFREFADLYSEAPSALKQRLPSVVVEEIRCSVKRGEKTGEFVYKLRGNGTIREKWAEAKIKRGVRYPHDGRFGSSCSLAPQETHENSNYILLRIPIEISNSAHGEKAISVAEAPLPSILPLSPAAISQLHDVRLIQLPRSLRPNPLLIDYAALQQTYRRMLAEGPFSNQAELARHLGVSRIQVSRVLQEMRRRAG